MKFRVIIYSILAVFAFMACDDDLSSVGMGVQPEGDRLSARTDTVSFTSSTQIMDSIYIQTSSGLLGNFCDPVYGEIQYGYLCNFYTSPNSVFEENMIEDKIDSVILRLRYYSLVGDSLAAMEATVYGIPEGEGKILNKNFYSNVDPWKYADKNLVWGKKSYTARNMNIPDSLYSNNYYQDLKIRLDESVGQKIYDKWKVDKGIFKDLDKFFEFFPGIYIESTHGSGNILEVDYTWLELYYQAENKRGKDSTYCTLFSASAEVTQLSRFKNKESDNLILVNNQSKTYLKTPAGVVTQLEIPLREIAEKVGNDRTFNDVRLSLEVVDNNKQGQYPLKIPPTVLLISPDSVKTFFEEVRSPNITYCYYAPLATSSAYKYNFGNISNVVQNAIKQLKDTPQDEWPELKLWVIPVSFSYYDTYSNPYFASHYYTPSGATLKKDNLKLYITTSKRN